jgi:hypothetical protein
MSNTRKILFTDDEIKLDDIMDFYNTLGHQGKFLSKYLKAYISERQDQFTKDYLAGDYVSHSEYENDKHYEFTFGNTKTLY